MATPDADLGIAANFQAQEFRNAVRFSMQMGAPTNPAKRAQFIKRSSVRTYWKDGIQLAGPPAMGRQGEPLDPDVEVRVAAPTIVTDVDVAIEISPARSDELPASPVGNFTTTKAEVTVLDVDYVKIDGFREMLYNGDTYLFGYEGQLNGLFGVDVHTLLFFALDEN